MAPEDVLSKFKPLEVVVRNGDVDAAIRVLKSMVQKEKILAILKEKQAYEKPSDKKRRKKREAREKQRIADRKRQLEASR